MSRPKNDQRSKENREELCKLTREFAANLLLHSPQLDKAKLERQLGMSTYEDANKEGDGGNSSHGKKLKRWLNAGQPGGQCCKDAEELQFWVEIARKKGLLPPLRAGGLRRLDQFHVKHDLAKIVDERLAQARELERARAAAVAALAAYASAVKGAGDWMVVAEVIDHGNEMMPDGEINNAELVQASPDELLDLARKIEGHWWHFMPSH